MSSNTTIIWRMHPDAAAAHPFIRGLTQVDDNAALQFRLTLLRCSYRNSALNLINPPTHLERMDAISPSIHSLHPPIISSRTCRRAAPRRATRRSKWRMQVVRHYTSVGNPSQTRRPSRGARAARKDEKVYKSRRILSSDCPVRRAVKCRLPIAERQTHNWFLVSCLSNPTSTQEEAAMSDPQNGAPYAQPAAQPQNGEAAVAIEGQQQPRAPGVPATATPSDASAPAPGASSPLKPPAPVESEQASLHVAPQDSASDVKAAAAATESLATDVQAAQPASGPGHEADVQAAQQANGQSGVAAPDSAPVSAPGTGNPFNVKEEADVGAAATEAPQAAERPSEQDVAPAKEAVLSPVEVNGGVAGAVKSEDDATAQPQSSIAEPESKIGVGADTAPTSAEAQPPVAPSTTDDVVMSDATQPAPAVAPAVAGLGGDSAPPPPPTATEASPTAANGGQPPLKRQRTATLSQGPEKSGAARPAFADSASIEMTTQQVKYAQNSIKSLKGRPESQAFLVPVDPEALNIPNYRQIVTHPMDLGTIDIKLALTVAAAKGGKPSEKTKMAPAWNLDPARDVYHSVEEFEQDVRLVFANCIKFNGPAHLISQSAKTLEAVFEKQLKSMPSDQPPPPPPAPAAAAGASEAEKRARRPSNPVPTIRRSSSDASGRPKREIHPPAPRDLPYADEPQSASSGKKRKSSKAMTPRQQAYWAKVHQEELKYCSVIVQDLFTKPTLESSAWPFYHMPDRNADFGPAYYAMIKKPICLSLIQDRLRDGVYKGKDDFASDMNLLLNNCFTFNPPDSDVYVMGQNVQTYFQDKMKKMPQPRPLSPEPDDDDDDDDGEDEEELVAKISALEDELAQLRQRLQTTKSNKTAAAAKKKAAKAAAAEAAAKRKAARNAAKSSGGGGGSGDGSFKKSKKKKSAYTDGSDEEEGFRAVTYEQKEELAAKIGEMGEDRLEGALKIISEDKPQDAANGDDEIELDIDDLSPRILYKLYRYVVKPKRKPGPKPGTAKGSSAKYSSNKKRKNLDEEQEAARIQALQDQLNSFDKGPEAAGGAAVAPTAAPAGHDDLVQSESSSGEEDSDGSDSDY